jgi:hypothetical protein
MRIRRVVPGRIAGDSHFCLSPLADATRIPHAWSTPGRRAAGREDDRAREGRGRRRRVRLESHHLPWVAKPGQSVARIFEYAFAGRAVGKYIRTAMIRGSPHSRSQEESMTRFHHHPSARLRLAAAEPITARWRRSLLFVSATLRVGLHLSCSESVLANGVEVLLTVWRRCGSSASAPPDTNP